MTEPAPTEVVWPSSAVVDDGSLVLVDGARSRVSLCRCAGGVAVVKRFRGATANRHRDAASRRFAAERRAAWALADASPFVLRPLATVVDAPVMAVALPFWDGSGRSTCSSTAAPPTTGPRPATGGA